MRLVDALTVTLRDWGVSYVFGVSGANIEHLHDAIHRLGEDRLDAVLARSEAGAAFMADSRARIHHTLGVCCCTSGGGMMNLAAGIAEAYQESVPVLAIIGQPPTTLHGKGGFQDSSGIGRTVNAVALWQSMTKLTTVMDDPSAFWEQLDEAVSAALGGRQGPAALLVPRDMWDAEVPPRPATLPRTLPAFRAPVEPAETDVRRLFSAIRSARHPVLLLGTGADRCEDPSHIAAFARAAGIPVVSTMANPGIYPHDDPGYLGMVGVAGHPSAHAWMNGHADLIVAVGTGLNVMTRGPLAPALARADVAVVNVDPDAVARILDPAVTVRGDAGETFAALAELHGARPFRHLLPTVTPTRFVARLADPAALPDHGALPVGDTLLQSEAIHAIQPHLPVGGHLLFDAGNCAATALHYLSVPAGTSSTIALGMGGMGYAIAGAIGAQLGSTPEARTMVLCGDGAFLIEGFEVHTAVEQRLPILFVVFNNNKHGMCVTRQQLFFDGEITATTYPKLDVASIGRGLGEPDRLWVRSVGTRAELESALATWATVDGPGVLELRLPHEEVPPFTPFLGADAETYAATPTSVEHAA